MSAAGSVAETPPGWPPASGRGPRSVLFMCSMNTVRSPIGAALARRFYPRGLYVASAGVRKGEPDGFAVAVMEERGIDIARHRAQTIEELEDTNFDVVITLAPEAHHRALELTRTMAVSVEYWPTADPTLTEGTREQVLEAYRAVRDQLAERIKARFGGALTGN